MTRIPIPPGSTLYTERFGGPEDGALVPLAVTVGEGYIDINDEDAIADIFARALDAGAEAARDLASSMVRLGETLVTATFPITEAFRRLVTDLQDEEWRRVWYRDPGSAWWER